jgi:hypothetical protein
MAQVSLPVVLIGPVNAGKSTIAPMLAALLGVEHVGLDEVCWEYFEQDPGYDEGVARQHFLRGGQPGALAYMVRFYPGAVARVVREHPRSVIELGAGHSVYEDPEYLARVKEILAPCRNVILLLPSPDPETSLQILNARQSNPHPDVLEMNARFVRHPSNQELATMTVYTEGKTPEETCQEIMARLR